MDSYTIYYGLTFLAIIITVSAQWYVNHNYKKFLNVFDNGYYLIYYDEYIEKKDLNHI